MNLEYFKKIGKENLYFALIQVNEDELSMGGIVILDTNVKQFYSFNLGKYVPSNVITYIIKLTDILEDDKGYELYEENGHVNVVLDKKTDNIIYQYLNSYVNQKNNIDHTESSIYTKDELININYQYLIERTIEYLLINGTLAPGFEYDEASENIIIDCIHNNADDLIAYINGDENQDQRK